MKYLFASLSIGLFVTVNALQVQGKERIFTDEIKQDFRNRTLSNHDKLHMSLRELEKFLTKRNFMDSGSRWIILNRSGIVVIQVRGSDLSRGIELHHLPVG